MDLAQVAQFGPRGDWRIAAKLAKIIGVGLKLEADRRRGDQMVIETVLLAVGNGRIARRKIQPDLWLGVGGAVPAGEWVRSQWIVALEFEQPLAGVRLSRLGGLAFGFGNAGNGHCLRLVAKSPHRIKPSP